MLADLSGIDRKLARAREHFDSVQAEETLWIEAQRDFITVKPKVEPIKATHAEGLIRFTMQVESVIPVPHRVPVLIGDCVQNLRAALDHLAFQLVVAAEGKPTEHTAFPIYEDRIVQHGKGQRASDCRSGRDR